jgi:hypothetical protein
MSMLLLMFLTGRRFGWQGQVVFLGTLGFFVETRERFWFSVLLPALTYSMGAAPLLASVAIIIIGGILGLLTMRLIAGPAGKRASARREALRARA